ncbi:hypothetical protein ACGFZ9_47350 [Streptomyces mirabilis]|uniref:hypothetical protein n=1 Tax=Streptomyces mirabilis TaxID=68239 RepID=UPI00371AFC8F
MGESNAKRQPRHPSRRTELRADFIRYLRKSVHRPIADLTGEFLRGAVYKLGSGAVTLIILWWETRR